MKKAILLFGVLALAWNVSSARASGNNAPQTTGGLVAKTSDLPLSQPQREEVGRPSEEQTNAWRLQFEEADRNTKRLSPMAFPDLPRGLVHNLQKRGCAIPQQLRAKKRENVIRGEFSRPGQSDLAVLCSRNRISSILVFWNGSTQNPSEIAKAPDMSFLQNIGNNEIGFSRVINAVDGKTILQFYHAFGGPKPPPIDHQGINDAFEGKASVINYYYRGRWLKLTGAD
jgi:hypothetical protein